MAESGLGYVGWYRLLCILRILFVLGPSYIHPDEFFQSPEVVSHALGRSEKVSWEWEQENALRSAFFPFVVCGGPFLGLDFWGVDSSMLRLVLPRMVMVCMSFLIDWSVWKCAAEKCRSKTLCMMASSWPMLVFGSRTFSNTMETVLFALLLYCWHTMCEKGSQGRRIGAMAGCVGALGVFCRFTFVAFAFPYAVVLMYKLKLKSQWRAVLAGIGSFIFCTAVLICIDSIYYHGGMHLEVSPWNAFQYNRSVENVAQHGLHPRWLHAVVHVPMLFLPLLLRIRKQSVWITSSMISVAILSVSPHQEPRFLLPLLVPLALAAGDGADLSISDGIFSLGMCILFGILHQGGVVPLLLMLSRESNRTITGIVFHKTYSPPGFLLPNSFSIRDLMGAGSAAAIKTWGELGGGTHVVIASPIIPEQSWTKLVCWPFHLDLDNLAFNLCAWVRDIK